MKRKVTTGEVNFRDSMRNTPAGRLLLRAGYEPIDAESSARRVAAQAIKEIAELVEILSQAAAHLQYCGWGDAWERECAFEDKLPERIKTVLRKYPDL